MTPRTDIDDLISQMRGIAPEGLFLGLHYRAAVPLLTVQTFPDPWLAHYRAQSFGLRDPLLAWGFMTMTPTRWSDPAFLDPYGILAQGRRFGVIHGVTLGCGQVPSRSVASVTHPGREFNDDEMDDLRSLLAELHMLTQRSGLLTAAQADALRLIADGDRQDAAATHLGITRSALKARLAGARVALQARTTAEAIQRARHAGVL
ncbi:MAG: autoinducer binding domain-containing protein [Alphaproteobacteria bacterium]|nr:autoinducer binding domain-containing protein [Alphaproteobacteria bacterium]